MTDKTLVMFAGLLLFAPAAAASGGSNAPDACAGHEAAILVSTTEHVLRLCEGGTTAAHYAVTIRSGGAGKRKEGDRRTPLGRYPLQAPRASADFGVFIGIGYPTAEQRAQGYTGSSIGIHGPPRALARLRMKIPASVLALDWTRGCIAVSTDSEIEAIATWVTRSHTRAIQID